MGRPAIANRDNVERAVDALTAAGKEPTIIAVHELTGGSYKTVQTLLLAELAKREAAAIRVNELPPEITKLGGDLGTRMAAEIHSRLSEIANGRFTQLQTEAREQIERLEIERTDLVSAVMRLEAEAEQLSSSIAESERVTAEANQRAATAEGCVAQQSKEIARQAEAFSIAQAGEHRAIAEAAELRGRIAALEKLIETRSERETIT